MSSAPIEPNSSHSIDITGADVLGRYRYQAAYAAYVALDMLRKQSTINELYHEHHEDILLKLKNGEFIAYQVKTRDIKYGPFKFQDDQIINSLARFSEFEEKFPNSCQKYVIAANCGFWGERKNSNNIDYCISGCKNNDNDILNNMNFCRNIDKITKKVNVSKEMVLTVLKKVELIQSPYLSDLNGPIIKKMVDVTSRKYERYDTLISAAEELTNKMLKIGSMDYELALDTYIIIQEDPDDALLKENISSKKITKEDIMDIIEESLNSVSSLLTSKDPIEIDKIPRGITKMELKMAKGGLSFENIDNIKNLKYSTEVLFTGWITKYGRDQANLYYEDLLLSIRNQCLEVHDQTKQENKIYGTEMLINIRERLKYKYSEDISKKFKDFKYEHLIGIIGILTEECKIWWSKKFNIKEGQYL